MFYNWQGTSIGNKRRRKMLRGKTVILGVTGSIAAYKIATLESMLVKKNLVSFHVEKLVQEGYLERESITGDRRQVRLLLTGKSQRVIEQGRSVQQRYREILVSNIAPSDFETSQRCMDTIRQNIERAKKISAKAKSTEKGDKKR